MSDVLLVEKLEGRIALLTVNRPDKMNALNGEVRDALFDAFRLLASDDDVRVVVITGAGEKAFIAGADIAEFKDARAVEQYRSMQAGNIYSLMEGFPKPIIAMINGYCLGGGCELAMACDMRIAAETARIGQPEIKVGVFPPLAVVMIPRLVPEKRAFELIAGGEVIRAGNETVRFDLSAVDDVRLAEARLVYRKPGQPHTRSPISG